MWAERRVHPTHSHSETNSPDPRFHDPDTADEAQQQLHSQGLEDKEIDQLKSVLHADSLITLKEQLEIDFTDKRRREAAEKMTKKIEDADAEILLKNRIITFKYATDYTFLRRSSPEDVWNAILRREAWNQIPVAMVLVTLVQVSICCIVLIAGNSPLNLSTLVMAVMYVIAMASSNPFVITKELTVILRKQYERVTQTKYQVIFVHAACVLLCPLILLVLCVAYAVTAILDFTTGPILDVSFAGMVNILINILVVFSALSIGLRSDNPINAIQTFVGFDFVNNMDETILVNVNVDLLAPTVRVNNGATKMLTVRIGVYVTTIIILAGTTYLTISNDCLLFCNGAPL